MSALLEEVGNTMPNTSSRIEPLLTDMNQGGPDEREEASETIIDWLTTITAEEASQLAAALVAAAVNEKTLAAKEAELNALGELASHGLLTREAVLPLAALGRPMPGTTGREHLEFLDEKFELWPQ
jgi:hypothetical protein